MDYESQESVNEGQIGSIMMARMWMGPIIVVQIGSIINHDSIDWIMVVLIMNHGGADWINRGRSTNCPLFMIDSPCAPSCIAARTNVHLPSSLLASNI